MSAFPLFAKVSPGNAVAVIAPASPAPEATMAAGIERIAGHFRVRTYSDAPWIRQPGTDLPYLAASDGQRLAELQQALRDDEVRAIFCARGGYGSTRLLSALSVDEVRQAHKPIIGFSDITALHALWRHAGVVSIHGPVVNQLASLDVLEQEQLFSLLMQHQLPSVEGLRGVYGGQASGPLFGGNLSILGALCGTPYQVQLRGAILIIEEIQEPPYRVDRLLTQLRLSGAFEGLRGIVVGDFIRCDRSQGVPPMATTAKSVLLERLADLGIPVVFGAGVGHGDRNCPLPLGVRYRLDARAGTLHPAGSPNA